MQPEALNLMRCGRNYCLLSPGYRPPGCGTGAGAMCGNAAATAGKSIGVGAGGGGGGCVKPCATSDCCSALRSRFGGRLMFAAAPSKLAWLMCAAAAALAAGAAMETLG